MAQNWKVDRQWVHASWEMQEIMLYHISFLRFFHDCLAKICFFGHCIQWQIEPVSADPGCWTDKSKLMQWAKHLCHAVSSLHRFLSPSEHGLLPLKRCIVVFIKFCESPCSSWFRSPCSPAWCRPSSSKCQRLRSSEASPMLLIWQIRRQIRSMDAFMD